MQQRRAENRAARERDAAERVERQRIADEVRERARLREDERRRRAAASPTGTQPVPPGTDTEAAQAAERERKLRAAAARRDQRIERERRRAEQQAERRRAQEAARHAEREAVRARARGADPYAILGVAPDTTAEEVDRVYRRLALEHHPDRHRHRTPQERASHEAQMKRVNVAYGILGDPQRRAAYHSSAPEVVMGPGASMATPPATQSALLRPVAGGIIALAAAMGIGRFAFTPILPAMQRATGLDTAQAGLLAAANYAGYLVGALLITVAVPVNARRGVLLGSLVTVAATTALMAVTSAFPLWAAIRFLSGLASAGVFVLASGLVLDLLRRAGHASRSGWLYSGPGLGIAVSGVAVLALGIRSAGAATG